MTEVTVLVKQQGNLKPIILYLEVTVTMFSTDFLMGTVKAC